MSDDGRRSKGRLALDALFAVCVVALASALAFFSLVFILSVVKLAWRIAP